jgi:hypothetical protein
VPAGRRGRADRTARHGRGRVRLHVQERVQGGRIRPEGVAVDPDREPVVLQGRDDGRGFRPVGERAGRGLGARSAPVPAGRRGRADRTARHGRGRVRLHVLERAGELVRGHAERCDPHGPVDRPALARIGRPILVTWRGSCSFADRSKASTVVAALQDDRLSVRIDGNGATPCRCRKGGGGRASGPAAGSAAPIRPEGVAVDARHGRGRVRLHVQERVQGGRRRHLARFLLVRRPRRRSRLSTGRRTSRNRAR